MNALDIVDETERADAIKAQAVDFLPTLRSKAEETEALRRLPDETVADLKRFGFSRLCQPRKYGGAELPFDRAVDIIATLAGGCASTAWVCAIYTDHSILASMFPENATDAVWGGEQTAAISAGYHPMGRVVPDGDDWRLSGQWGWVSGCDFADWFLLGAFIDGDDGPPAHHFFLVPRSEIEIEDNWHVMGLRGTGSKNVIVNDAFVPAHHVMPFDKVNGGALARGDTEDRPLYRLGHISVVPFVFVAVALGIAESLFATLTEQIAGRQSMGHSLAALQSMQLHVSETSAEIDCARLLMMRDTADAMAAMRDRRPLTMLERGRNRRDMAYAARLCKSAVNRLHDMAGASGIFDSHVSQRKFRDLQAASRHIGLAWDIGGTTCGEIMLGREPTSPFV